MSATRSLVLPFVLLSFAVFLSSCSSSGSGSKGSAQAPIFSTIAPTGAAQGTAYSYQVEAVDPSGGTVTFALTTGPTGATISGSTISWTPTAAQSRTGNNFVVTATTSEGANATQSWSVSPTGIITVNVVNTYWEPSGPVQVPDDAAVSASVSVVVPNSDGSLTVLKGATAAPGVVCIAGVPAGNYWLTSGNINTPFPLSSGGSAHWTGASTIDLGSDVAWGPSAATTSENQTTVAFNLSGLDSVNAETAVTFSTGNQGFSAGLSDFPNSTSLAQTLTFSTDVDFSEVTSAFLAQYELTTLGSFSMGVTGPSALLSNLTIANGGSSTITQTLSSTPASLGVSVQGSQWASTLTGASVSAPNSYLSGYSVIAEPFVVGVNAPVEVAGAPALNFNNIVLAATPYVLQPDNFFFGQFISCDPTGFSYNSQNTQPGITTDETLGTLQYSDSLPSTWTRAETFCDEALTPVAIPNSSSTANFALVTSASTPPSSTPLIPVVSPVQSPLINNASLFAAATLNMTTPSLSWSAPATGSPYGYAVVPYLFTNSTNAIPYVATTAFYSSQTSITLPPLSAGNTYVFSITALVDGAANVQTSPFRSALPTGYASVVSAPITISSSAPEVKIHGDAGVVRGLSQPQATGSQASKPNVIKK